MTAVTLRFIDPENNKWRFYRLDVQPDLFGQWCLVREWGRIGSQGQTMTTAFPSEVEAELALNRLCRSKTRRGYVVF